MHHFYSRLKDSAFLLLLVVTVLACSKSKKKNNNQNSDRSSSLKFVKNVAFVNASNDTLATIEAALADNEHERSEGLMDVRDLPQSKGMLFIFNDSKKRSFWMANTPLPLDIIFVNADKKIVRIHHNAEPFSEKNLGSDKPARFVIETNAGFCVSHDIQEGMSVIF